MRFERRAWKVGAGYTLRRRWVARVAIAVVVALALGWVAATGRVGLDSAARTAALIPDLLVFQPLRPSVLVTPTPRRERIAVASSGGQLVSADLYAPGERGRFPAVVVLLGVYPAPLDDPVVERLGDALARSGYVTVIPESARLRVGQIAPEEVDDIVAVFGHTRARPDVEPTRVSLIGFSVGGALALLAAADSRISGDVRAVMTVGAYFDAVDLLRAIGSGAMVDHGRPPWTPSEFATTVYRQQIIAVLPDPRDREELAQAFLGSDPRPVDVSRLSADGRVALALVSGGDAATIDRLMAALPESSHSTLRRLSPRQVIDAVRGPVFVLHDVGDRYVPVSESRRLAERLGDRAVFREYRLFAHVTPAAPADPLALPGDVL
ncbi:MAG: hypothetical protein NZ518_10720, partial [Dehalococcoidia bacterium]|nr:hypothetical protein [Dehalococcoidia bacterium]